MRKLQREATTPNFVPDYMASSLLDVDFKELKERGIRFIAFDADSTLVHYRAKALSDETKLFLQKQRKLFESWCIASNRITNDLLPLAEAMDAQVVRATLFVRKPQRRFFSRVLRHFGAKPYEVAMVGDKLVADMLGGKRSGLTTVWVERIGPDSLWDRHLFHTRRWEKRLMRRYME
jgi:uncharacterized protein